MPLTVVLSVGLDPGLLKARNLVLQSAGYVVVSAFSIKEAAKQFQAGDFDLVLLCQTIPAKDRDGLTWWMRSSGSGIPVVCVSGSLWSGDVVAGVTVGSEPSALLLGIQEVLISTRNRTAQTEAPLDKHDGEAAPMKKASRLSAELGQTSSASKKHFAHLTRAS
jgi:DNA-binding response OmpR family regulator